MGKEFGLMVISAVARRVITDPKEVHDLLALDAGASMFKTPVSDSERRTGVGHIGSTRDANGDLLVAGKIYLYREKRIRIQREEFGSGNIMDTYYRVFYLDDTLEERFLVVDGTFPNGPFHAQEYRSKLIPVPEGDERK